MPSAALTSDGQIAPLSLATGMHFAYISHTPFQHLNRVWTTLCAHLVRMPIECFVRVQNVRRSCAEGAWIAACTCSSTRGEFPSIREGSAPSDHPKRRGPEWLNTPHQ
eukprot:6194915-Pleurochrysis_carterae.AAC.2